MSKILDTNTMPLNTMTAPSSAHHSYSEISQFDQNTNAPQFNFNSNTDSTLAKPTFRLNITSNTNYDVTKYFSINDDNYLGYSNDQNRVQDANIHPVTSTLHG